MPHSDVAENPKDPRFADDPVAALHLYRERGYHFEPGVWSTDDIARLTRVMATLEDPSGAMGSVAQNPHLLSPEFMAAARAPKVVSALRAILGQSISGLQGQLMWGLPGAVGFSAHQDNFYVRTLPDAFVTAWHALDPADPENGGLFIYPGSHREPVLPVDPPERPVLAAGAPQHVTQQVAVLPQGKYREVGVRVNPGSMLLMHAHLVHGSYRNRSETRTRRSFLFTYLQQGAPFRAGMENKRQPFPVT